jgi:ubiquinone/menaquinone biosynthesis C-methylase UbiE
MADDYGTDLFKGTAWYYVKYRPLYPSLLIRFLIDKFSLNGEGRMLDLGCGSGQLALRFHDWFEQVVGVDTEPEMLEQANRLSIENRIENVVWLNGKAENLLANYWGNVRLIIIAKAFHWMDRESILETMYNSCEVNGGIAIIDNAQKQEPLLWQIKVDEVVKKWLGNKRKAGRGIYVPPSEKYEDIVAKSKFDDIGKYVLPSFSHNWTIESIIGNLYSTSFAAKRFFGENQKRFEEDLKSVLLGIDSKGIFKEDLSISVITAFKTCAK